MGVSPKKSYAGLIILLVGGIISLIALILQVLMLYTPDIFAYTMNNVKMVTIIGLVASLISLVGIGVFIAEYRGHTP